MTPLKTKRGVRKSQGFTIVELLIVIVVIGILAAITIVGFNGVQSRARDSERTNEIRAIQKKLEIFFTENGYYPNSGQVRDATYRQNTFGLNDPASRPANGSSIAYCWATVPTQYCYVAYRPSPLTGDCTGVSDTEEKCVRYTLSYRLEADPDTRIDVRSLQQ